MVGLGGRVCYGGGRVYTGFLENFGQQIHISYLMLVPTVILVALPLPLVLYILVARFVVFCRCPWFFKARLHHSQLDQFAMLAKQA